jgi:hypothetical protein
MITLAEFRQLSLPRRAYTTWNHATFLACMDGGRAGRSLYFLSDFYVELIYDFQGNRELGVVPFYNGGHLEEWLEQVSINELLGS